MSFFLCFLTTLSLCTLIGQVGDARLNLNTESTRALKDPAMYCALRQAVGSELGVAIGLAFYLAFTVNVAFHITGFSVMLSDSLPQLASRINVFPWNPPGSWVEVAMSSGLLTLVTIVCSRGVVFSAKTSLAILVIILVCIAVSLLVVLLPTDEPGPPSPAPSPRAQPRADVCADAHTTTHA